MGYRKDISNEERSVSLRTVLKRIHISPYGLSAIALIAIDALVRLVLIAQGWPETNSDEGTMGLEAMHIAFRGEHPIFLYGQNYMGMVEAYLGAVLFRLFGVSLFNLRLGMILLFTLFLIAMYFLTSLLYSKKLALVVLALLGMGTRTTFMTELLAVGGAVETLLFGTLLMLLASWLALTYSDDNVPRKQRWRYVVYGCWGFACGIGLYSHMLVLPFVAMSGLILLVFCRYELRRWGLLWLVVGFLIGATPLIIYNVTAPFDQNSLAVLLELHRIDANSAGAPHGLLLLVKELLGTFLYSLPTATNLSPICALQDLPLFGPTIANTVSCTIIQGGWSLGYMALLVIALFLAARPLWTLWRQREHWRPWRTRRSAATPTPVSSIEVKKYTILEFARLMLLLSAVLTIFLFITSPTAAVRPWSTRYLVGLLIALPAVLWPLWQGVKTTVQKYDGRPQGGSSQPEYDGCPQGGSSQPEYDGRPQGGSSQPENDGRPQGGSSQPENDGRPQGASSTPPRLDEDGRPQGAPPIHPTSPVPTMYGSAHGVARPSSSGRFALALRSSLVLLIGVVFLIGTIAIFALVPDVQALNQQDNVLVHDLSLVGVTHMYSDYWTCDRLIFLTQEHIICGVVNDATTGPGLNRYTPYYNEVQADPHSAYIFVVGSSYASAFELRIAANPARYHKLLFDGYVVYVPVV